MRGIEDGVFGMKSAWFEFHSGGGALAVKMDTWIG